MICRPTTFFIIYTTSVISKKCWEKNLRYVAKFEIILALRFKFTFPILLVYKIKLGLLVFIKIVLFFIFMYCFIFDNKSIQIIDKIEYIR